MNCPKCGEVLEDGMRFCTKCGTNIEEALKEEKEKIRLEAEKLKKEQEEREAKRLEYEKRERELKEEAERRRQEDEKRQKELKEAEERRKLEEEKNREELRLEKERLEEEKRKIEEEKRKLEEDKLRAIREAEELKRAKEENENKEKLAEENKEDIKPNIESETKEEPKIPKEAEFKPAKQQETVVKKKRKGFIRRFFDRLILLIVILAILIGGIYYLNLKGYIPEPISSEINSLIDQIKDVRSAEKEEYKNIEDDENTVEENSITDESISGEEWVVENTIEADDIENLNKDVSAIVKDGKYGIIDNETGKILLDTKYENVSIVAGQIIVSDNGKKYSVDSRYQLGEETNILENTMRLEYLYNTLDNKAYVYTGENSLRELSKSESLSSDMIIVESVNIREDDMSISNDEIEVDYDKIDHLGMYGVYSINDNKLVSECEYDKIYEYSEGFAAYKKENVSGYLDNQGKDIGITFEETRNVYDGLSWVKKDGKWGLYKVTK